MNNRLALLGGILVVQLLLVAFVLVGGADESSAGTSLLDLDAATVDEFVIEGEGESITLTRTDGGWSAAGWPADGAKADELLQAFADMKAPWPVATTATSAERFEVTADSFQRRIVFRSSGNALATVYLGTSPGFQRVHASTDGTDDVFAIPFSNFKAPTGIDDWLDKSLLATNGAVQSVVSSRGWTLARGEEGWLLDGAAADQDAGDTYAERYESLRVLSVQNALPDGAAEAGTLDVVDGEGMVTYTLSHHEPEDDYYIGTSRREGVFEIATYIAEQLLTDRDSLAPAVVGEASEEETPDGSS